jgi:hypothetical protein
VRLAAPWFRRLIAGFSSRRPIFDPRPDRVRFVVCKVPLGQILLRLLPFSPVIVTAPMLHIRLRLTRRTSGRSLGNLQKSSPFSEIWNNWIKNYNFHAVTLRTIQFSIQQFHVLPTQCVCVFCVDLRTNSDYFPIQH